MIRYCITALLPLCFILLSVGFRQMAGPYSGRSIDPEYIYFVSGLSMGNGIPDVAHIDNPGTPLQLIGAAVFRLYWYLEGKEMPFSDFILLNSDESLAYLNLSLSLLLSFIFWLGGNIAFKMTSSMPTTLLIQSLAMVPGLWFTICGRVTPELLFPIPGIFVSLLLLQKLHYPKERIHPLKLAILQALGLSIKLSWAPLLMLSPFLISSKRDRWHFTLYLPLGFFSFAFPVLFRFPQFKNWVKNLFLHSGRYGSGEKEVVDPQMFFRGLADCFSLEPWLCLVLLTLIIACFGFIVKKDQASLLLTGVSLTLLAGVLMVAKHFEYRYLFPVLLLFPIWVILAVKSLQGIHLFQAVYFGRWIRLVLVVVFVRAWLHGQNYAAILKQDRMQYEINQAYIGHNLPKAKSLILVSQGYGAPFPEYALAYSIAWAGPESLTYKEILGRYYPNTWQYFTWDKKTRFWGETPDFESLKEEERPVYIYLEKHSPQLIKESLGAIFPEQSSEEYNIQVLFQNPVTGESISRLLPGSQ